MTLELETVEVGAAEDAQFSVIWMHGLGADGNDFVPIVPELALPENLRVRFVFPHAPVQPVTINGGMEMRAWFDIKSLDRELSVDVADLERARGGIEKLIDAEVARGVPVERIILAGFSQGGAMSLYIGLRYPQKLAGIMALSTWLPARERLAEEASAVNKSTDIFMAHGSFDPMVPCAFGEASCEFLKQAGYSVGWHSYPMQHQVCLEQIADIGRWLVGRFEDAAN